MRRPSWALLVFCLVSAIFASAYRPGMPRYMNMAARSALDTTAPTDGASVSMTPLASSIQLDWDAATDDIAVVRYRVHCREVASGEPAPSCIDGTDESNNNVVGLTHTVLSLDEDTEYSCRVCAVDAAGNVSEGIVDQGYPLDETNPTDGTAIVFTPGDTQIVLDWGNASDNRAVDHYEVRYAVGTQTAPANCSSGTAFGSGTCNDPTLSTCTATGLNNMVYYAFRVCAVDAAGNASSGLTGNTQPFVDSLRVTFDGTNELYSAGDHEDFECDDEDRLTAIVISMATACADGVTCDNNQFSKGTNSNITFDMLVEFRVGGWQGRYAVGGLANFNQTGTFLLDRWTIQIMTYDGAQVDGGDVGVDANNERLDIFATTCGSGSNPTCDEVTEQAAGANSGTIPATLSNQATSLFIAGFDPATAFNHVGHISEAALFCNGKVTATQINDCLLNGSHKMNNLNTLSERSSGGTACTTIFSQPRAWFRMGDSDGTETDSETTVYNRFNLGNDMTGSNIESGDIGANNL